MESNLSKAYMGEAGENHKYFSKDCWCIGLI
jgi:hypothetical protein